MATILRTLSYRHQWLYNLISRAAALSVGGEQQFRHLPLRGLMITQETTVLDLCCGSGQTTQLLCKYSHQVTGLDASPRSIEQATKQVPQATFIEAWAEAMPFENNCFDLVHTSVAMHEMNHEQRQTIFQEVFRVLKPGGTLTLIDFHAPQNPIYWPGLALFLWLFETETSWQMLQTDLIADLQKLAFVVEEPLLRAGGSLQVLHAVKPLNP